MAIKLSFHGAAGEVTGSMHFLELDQFGLLLDAGLFQGRRSETREKNSTLPLDVRQIDSIILSHAHIDHAGRLPLLSKHGYRGDIFCTPATRDLSAIMLADAAHIQVKDADFLRRHGRGSALSEPLYDAEDAYRVCELMLSAPYHRRQKLNQHGSFQFLDAGHILGSATVDLELIDRGSKRRIVFSGDIGRSGLPVIRDPEPPKGEVDCLIIESTYASKLHEAVGDADQRLAEVVEQTHHRSGKVLIPSFAVGRAQELIYALHALRRANRIPAVPIFVDSPLAIEATAVFRMHPELFDRKERLVSEISDLFDFSLVRYVRSVDESRALNSLDGPAIIIAASGMAESGRILHHLKHHGPDRRNTILFVGFQAEHTLGRRIQEGNQQISIYGEPVEIGAQIVTLGGYSAHADKDELRRWVRSIGGPIRRAFVVHGERGPLSAMAQILSEEGVGEVLIPNRGESFQL
jgi:metallo-beta-lactamase family protein